MRQKLTPLLFSALWAVCAIFLLRAPFNYSLYVPSSYRVIYIPLYFWIFYALYLKTSHTFFLRKELTLFAYIRKGIIPAFFLHLYLLLGNTIEYLLKSKGQLCGVYFLYIEAVFILFTFTVSYIAIKNVFFNRRQGIYDCLIYGQFIMVAAYFVLYNLSPQRSFALSIAFFAAVGLVSAIIKLDGFYGFFKKIFSKDIAVIIAIFMIAFIVRASFGAILVNKTTHGSYGYDGYLYASDDGLTYDATANKILADPSILKKGGVDLWGNWDQFYSIFLAFFYRLFGRNFYLLTFAQSIFGAFVPVFTYLLGKMLFSRAVGIIAGLLLSFKGGIIMLSAYMGHEAVWLPILYFFILLLTYYFKKTGATGMLNDAVTGLTLGVLSLFRSLYFYLVPFLWIWELAFLRKIKITRRIVHLAVITLVCAGMVAAVFHLLGNTIKPVNSQKAAILWHTSRLIHPFEYLGNDRFDALGINYFQDPLGSLKAIAERPLDFFILAMKVYPLRVVAYLETYQFGSFDPIYMVNPANIKNTFASTLEFYFTVFFVAGFFGCIRKRGILNSPIFLAFLFHIFFFCIVLFQASPRIKEISTPIMYLIGVFGAYNIFNFLSEHITERNRKKNA